MDFFNFVAQEWILVTILIVLIYLYVWRDRIKSGRPVSPHEVTRLVNEGNAVIVDLREGAEFKAGHIVGSVNIPYAKLSKESTEVASHKGKTLILVDKLGQHAGAVGRLLGKEGFEEVMEPENRAKARDRIVRMLNEKNFTDLDSIQGKLFLKDKIAGEVNGILRRGVVKDVFFSDFVVQ